MRYCTTQGRRRRSSRREVYLERSDSSTERPKCLALQCLPPHRKLASGNPRHLPPYYHQRVRLHCCSSSIALSPSQCWFIHLDHDRCRICGEDEPKSAVHHRRFRSLHHRIHCPHNRRPAGGFVWGGYHGLFRLLSRRCDPCGLACDQYFWSDEEGDRKRDTTFRWKYRDSYWNPTIST